MKSLGRVLVSGASVAGPTAGYWLRRYGFEVDVIEQADQVRAGGYAIDIRGSSIGVVERMGLLPQIRAISLQDRPMTLVDAEGEVLLKAEADQVMGSLTGFDVEVARGSLSLLLYEASLKRGCRYLFKNKIASLAQDGSKVQVTMSSGEAAEYDYVIGADGLHSATRRFVFGDESQCLVHMGYCYVAFSMPNVLGVNNESMMLSSVGKAVGLTHYPYSDRVYGLFVIADKSISVAELWDAQIRQRILDENFGKLGWHVPKMLEYVKQADDVFADIVSQTRMPCWSRGRVALVGDAAHAPGFITGQGTSLALATAYVLAGELALNAGNPEEAFAAYQREVRPFVEANQGTVVKNGWQMISADPAAARKRNESLRTNGLPERDFSDRQEIYSSLVLKDYGP